MTDASMLVHDLALSLGMTVAEVESRMTYAEFQSWIEYVRINGPLNLGLRVDAAIARALMPFVKRGTQMRDLMPWPKPTKEQQVKDQMQQVLSAFGFGGGKNG